MFTICAAQGSAHVSIAVALDTVCWRCCLLALFCIAFLADRGSLSRRFGGGLTGRAGLPQLADSFVSDPARHFAVGQSVRAQVVQVPPVTWRTGNHSSPDTHDVLSTPFPLPGRCLTPDAIAIDKAPRTMFVSVFTGCMFVAGHCAICRMSINHCRVCNRWTRSASASA